MDEPIIRRFETPAERVTAAYRARVYSLVHCINAGPLLGHPAGALWVEKAEGERVGLAYVVTVAFRRTAEMSEALRRMWPRMDMRWLDVGAKGKGGGG
jgi:hypothetical protein